MNIDLGIKVFVHLGGLVFLITSSHKDHNVIKQRSERA